MATLQKIYPCLWFNDNAEEAATFWCSIFERSRINEVTHYPKAGQEVHGHAEGRVMTVEFELEGAPFTGLNGGSHFKFNEAVSLQVMCETQAEIDRLWDKLNEGGDPKAQACGWLKDKFGVSWQIVPTFMREMNRDTNKDRKERAFAAMMKMKKLDIAALKKAADGA